NDPKASPGYTLIAPSNSNNTYLIDMEGRVVNTWKSDTPPGLSAYLLENGHLLRAGQVRNPPFFGGGAGGRIQEFTWDGKLVWDFTYVNDTQLPNHDICRLPNGNVLMNVWEKKTVEDAVAAGRRPETVGQGGVLSAAILEVQPTGEKTGKVVWEWHVWDHLIQEFDAQKTNYGDVAAHAERIDLNFGDSTIAAMVAKPEELDKLRSIGYIGGAGRRPPMMQADWLHINSVAYNAERDQILLSSYEFSEIWVIDHGTTTPQAAGHDGGKYGKGGDLLYRWGNPRAYRAGALKDQKLFGQHNAQWIARGLPGEGHILLFNNGVRRIGGAYSSVDEIAPPVDEKGGFAYLAGKAFGPDKAEWSYAAPKKIDLFAPVISGADRLANGDTLICNGPAGTVFEVTPKGETVWKYVNPEKGGGFPFGGPPGGGPFGGGPFGGPPKLGVVLPSFLQGFLRLTDDEKKQLDAVEKEAAEKLTKILTADQKKQFEEKPLGFGELPPPGKLLSAAVQDRLKLTDDQKKQVQEAQKAADEKLAGVLTDDQKKQLKQMQDGARMFAGGPPGGFPGGPIPFGGPPKLGQILSSFVQGPLNLTDDQKKQLEAAEKEAADKLAKLLTDDQKKQFDDRPPGFGETSPAGKLMSTALQDRLKFTDDQKKQLADLQKDVDGKLDAMLKDDQKRQLKQMQDMARGFPGGPPGGFPGGPGGFPGMGGPAGGGGLFRAPRYAADFPGLKDKELKPGKTIEELQPGPAR
ncbi:MAG TPA: aryl-sulfate sulfotransferase, partial [Gemmataceae bacterium]|nr:aryl-sulfate sulfotransferase [Gemmataceae bacterium]